MEILSPTSKNFFHQNQIYLLFIDQKKKKKTSMFFSCFILCFILCIKMKSGKPYFGKAGNPILEKRETLFWKSGKPYFGKVLTFADNNVYNCF
jgi:hypothetical protein